MIGKNAGNCLYNQRKYFDKLVGNVNEKNVSAESEKCDVVSIQEEEIQEKSVKEEHRLKSLNRKFAQCYMKSAWVDYEFINGLKANKVLSRSNQNIESFDIINREIDDCVEKTGRMIVITKSFFSFSNRSKTSLQQEIPIIKLQSQLNLSLPLFTATTACTLPSLHLYEPNVSQPKAEGESK